MEMERERERICLLHLYEIPSVSNSDEGVFRKS